jgi:hypothetical protein
MRSIASYFKPLSAAERQPSAAERGAADAGPHRVAPSEDAPKQQLLASAARTDPQAGQQPAQDGQPAVRLEDQGGSWPAPDLSGPTAPAATPIGPPRQALRPATKPRLPLVPTAAGLSSRDLLQRMLHGERRPASPPALSQPRPSALGPHAAAAPPPTAPSGQPLQQGCTTAAIVPSKPPKRPCLSAPSTAAAAGGGGAALRAPLPLDRTSSTAAVPAPQRRCGVVWAEAARACGGARARSSLARPSVARGACVVSCWGRPRASHGGGRPPSPPTAAVRALSS